MCLGMLARILLVPLLGAAMFVALPLWYTRGATQRLTPVQISSFRPYTQFARAAYCPWKTKDWSCGKPCKNLPGFIPQAFGGNGFTEPRWFVGYHPSLKSVVVSNEGTDPLRLIPLLVDADFLLTRLNSRLFPGISSSVRVHIGFQRAQKRFAVKKLMEVKKTMIKHNTTQIALTGHSLGGAISLIDSLYLSMHLPSANIKVVTYGMPRVGNHYFANLIDRMVPSVTRINNQQDIVPIVPGRRFHYKHPSGEIHIVYPGNWASCEGQENLNRLCTIGTVPNVFVGDVRDHTGYYDGIPITDC